MVDGATRGRTYVVAMQTMTPTQVFIDRLTERNFELLADALAPEIVARFLLPRGPEQVAGAQAIARRLEGWFGAADRFAVLSTVNEQIGRRRRLGWRFELCRD